MDWELRAKSLAVDLTALAVVAAGMGAGVLWAAEDWWAKVAGGWTLLAAAGALVSARMKP